MRLRIASIAFFLGAIGVGISWLTLQPALTVLLDSTRKLSIHDEAFLPMVVRVQSLLPVFLGLDFLLVGGLTFLVLQTAIGRPLGQAEEAVEQLSRLEGGVVPGGVGGPLLSRLQRALTRMGEALQQERALTRSQLDELERANLELTRMQTGLLAADRLATVGKLSAGVAHEVGNPLAGILGYLSLVRMRAKGNAELDDLVNRIEQEVQRIDAIVRSLLELGRPSRGNLGPVDLKRLCESTVELLAAGPDFRRVTVAVRVPEGLYAQAEAGKVSQVLINLVLNAAQAMNGEGALEVEGRAEASTVVLTVRDHGPGLAPQVLEGLFQPFFTTKEPGKGTGLGLAVSAHLAASMEGALTAANAANGGACFQLTLPRTGGSS